MDRWTFRPVARCHVQFPEQTRTPGTGQLHLLQDKQGCTDTADARQDEMEYRLCGARSVPGVTRYKGQPKKRGMAKLTKPWAW